MSIYRQRDIIKADTLASLEQSLLVKRIACLKLPIFKQVVAGIRDLINKRQSQ